MNVLDLFSGIGGFSLGLERAGMTTAAFCEIDPYARAVLRKHWPAVPCYEDIHDVTADRLARDGVGRIDLISGGYPCQPFSHAGKQRGHEDPRHLWPQMRRVIGEVRPAWVIAENVAGHITLGLDQVLADLEADGYAGRAIVVPACAKDAPHIRRRLWIMARDRDRDRESTVPVDAEVEGLSGDMADAARELRNGARDERQEGRREPANGSGPIIVADANVEGLERRHGESLRERTSERIAGQGSSPGRSADVGHPDSTRTNAYAEAGASRRPTREPSWWEPEPRVGRVAHGVPARMDRLRCLGNAVVPQVVEEIGRAILANHN